MDELADIKMPLSEHLAELRRRILISLGFIFVGMILVYFFYSPWVMWLLRGPLDTITGKDNPFAIRLWTSLFTRSGSYDYIDLYFISPLEPILVKLKVSFFGGIAIASPAVLFQIWRFVSAGLKSSERKIIKTIVPFSIGLFLAGCIIAYTVALPPMLYFLMINMAHGLKPSIIISKYVSVVVYCCLGFGIVFQLPLVMYLITRIGLVTPFTLAKSRGYAIVLIFFLAAILTPTTDIVNQTIMALPMIVLYELGLIVSRIAYKRRLKKFAG
jgi:sec-independent protein translocase protein TatC